MHAASSLSRYIGRNRLCGAALSLAPFFCIRRPVVFSAWPPVRPLPSTPPTGPPTVIIRSESDSVRVRDFFPPLAPIVSKLPFRRFKLYLFLGDRRPIGRPILFECWYGGRRNIGLVSYNFVFRLAAPARHHTDRAPPFELPTPIPPYRHQVRDGPLYRRITRSLYCSSQRRSVVFRNGTSSYLGRQMGGARHPGRRQVRVGDAAKRRIGRVSRIDGHV